MLLPIFKRGMSGESVSTRSHTDTEHAPCYRDHTELPCDRNVHGA
jgi:hypothetical protein